MKCIKCKEDDKKKLKNKILIENLYNCCIIILFFSIPVIISMNFKIDMPSLCAGFYAGFGILFLSSIIQEKIDAQYKKNGIKID